MKCLIGFSLEQIKPAGFFLMFLLKVDNEVGEAEMHDRSVSAARQRASCESLDGDGGTADHEEQLSDHHHAVGFLDYQRSLGIAQGQS